MILRYTTERPKTNRVLDVTSWTVDEFETLIPAFEATFGMRQPKANSGSTSCSWRCGFFF